MPITESQRKEVSRLERIKRDANEQKIAICNYYSEVLIRLDERIRDIIESEKLF